MMDMYNNNNQTNGHQISHEQQQQSSINGFDVHKRRAALALNFEEKRGRTRCTFGTGFTPLSSSGTPSTWAAACLNSADVDRLKFDTPEMEKFILMNNVQLQTPTPSIHDVNNNSNGHERLSNGNVVSGNGGDRNGNSNTTDEGYYDQEDIKPLTIINGQSNGHHVHHLNGQQQHFDTSDLQQQYHQQHLQDMDAEATEEQKGFVKGFEDALDIVRSRSESSASSTNGHHGQNGHHHHQQLQQQQQLHQQPQHVPTSINNDPMYQIQMSNEDTEDTMTTLHDMDSHGNDQLETMSMMGHNESGGHHSPINMADQEKAKLERKRLRNRIAASKCRRRKLEKISKLEEKVKLIKGENSELVNAVKSLKDHVMKLKAELLDHEKHGCHISIAYN